MGIDLAIIGGTGVYDPQIFNNVNERVVSTPYGEVQLIIGEVSGRQTAFLARHGKGHSVPPHLVNYRANIWALKQLGVNKIIATAAVGSLTEEFGPGSFVLADQFIDFTKTRPATFHTGETGVLHVDMTEPYCPELRQELLQQGKNLGIVVSNGGTYVCTEGPRFETPAEIRMYKLLGAHLVGMTSVPEVVLARECAMCYATVAMVTNYAAGISQAALTHQEVVENMAMMGNNLRLLIANTLQTLTKERTCSCQYALDELGKF